MIPEALTWPERCPTCGYHEPTQGCACKGTLRFTPGLAAKAQGQAAALSAHPSEAARVEAAIRQLAASGKPFSANDARLIHGVRGGVVGATFTAMRKARVIRQVGFTVSDKANTHAHPVAMWEAVA